MVSSDSFTSRSLINNFVDKVVLYVIAYTTSALNYTVFYTSSIIPVSDILERGLFSRKPQANERAKVTWLIS